MRFAIILAALLSAFPAAKALAHEFWIEPLEFQVSSGAEVQARLRIGQDFEGVSASYLPRNFTRFDVVAGGELRPVEGRLGNNPAMGVAGLPDGLAVILYETTGNTLTYDEWAGFLRFAEHKDFGDIAARHDARGLPRDGFREAYTRHAKSLVAIGGGAGQDTEFGLRTEIVALANPYTDDLTGGFPVRVLLEGAPRPDVQVELFDRAPDGSVTVTLHRTDADAIAVLPVDPGHAYLVDAVTLLPLQDDAEAGPVWESLWASLTFAVPGE